MKAIEDTTWWNALVHEHSGFGGFLILQDAPRRIAAANEGTRMIWVYTSDLYSSQYGMPIFFAPKSLGADDTCQPQQATFGSIIYLEEIPFGLTVAHPLAEQTHKEKAQSSKTIRSIELIQSQPLLDSPSLVGQLVCSSEGKPSDGVDWALIALNANYFSSIKKTICTRLPDASTRTVECSRKAESNHEQKRVQ